MRASQAAASLRSQLIKQRAHLASVEAQVTNLQSDSGALKPNVGVRKLSSSLHFALQMGTMPSLYPHEVKVHIPGNSPAYLL